VFFFPDGLEKRNENLGYISGFFLRLARIGHFRARNSAEEISTKQKIAVEFFVLKLQYTQQEGNCALSGDEHGDAPEVGPYPRPARHGPADQSHRPGVQRTG